MIHLFLIILIRGELAEPISGLLAVLQNILLAVRFSLKINCIWLERRATRELGTGETGSKREWRLRSL